MMSTRVRLSFDELVPGYSQKTWFLVDTTSCRLVADLEHQIQRKFHLPKNSSVNLYIEGFLLPAQEKIEIIRDGDIIRVEQASFYKEKGKGKCSNVDLASDVKPSKKQKLDGKPQTSIDIQVMKNKPNKLTNNKNQGRKTETKLIDGTDNSGNEKLRSGKVKVDKHCKVEKGQDKGFPTKQISSSHAPTVRKRIPPSSDILRKVNRGAKRSKIGNSSKRNEKGNPLSASISSSSTSSSFTSDLKSSSLSSEDSSDDTLSFSSSSSSSSMLSSSSSEDSSDDNQKKGLNLKIKAKGLNKNTKTKAKVYPATNVLSAERQSKNVKNLSDSSKQSKKDGLNSKEKEKDQNKNAKSKAMVHESSKRQDENIRNQSKASNQLKKDGSNLKEKKDLDKNDESKATVFKSYEREDENTINRSKTSNQSKKDGLNSRREEKATDKNTKNKSTKVSSFNGNTGNQPKAAKQEAWNTHLTKPKSDINTPAQNISNSHIRFDSDEENQDISACKEKVDSDTTQDPDNFCNAAANGSNTTQGDAQEDSKMPSHSDVHLLNNGGVDRNGNEMDERMGHAAATKKTAVDYSTLPSLCGPPRAGDRIAYKVLELSASYTPEMSDYKEGSVLGYNPVKNEVLLELTEDSLMKPLGDGNISTKFELIYGDEEEESIEARPPAIVDRKVSVPWTSMVDPRLIPGVPPGDTVPFPIRAV